MKVLQLIKTPDGAGWAYRQVRVLTELGVEVHVAIPGRGRLSDAYDALGVRTHDLQTDLAALRSPPRYLDSRERLRRLTADESFDLIHSHFVGTTMFARMALGRCHGTPRLFQVPGPLHLENPVTRAAELATAGPRDYWLATCKATAQIYRRSGVPDERLGLSYYGVDLATLDSGGRADIRGSFGLPASTKLIGMVAYIYPPKRLLGQTRGLKGHEDLIDAAAILRAQGQDVACIFVGGPWGKAGVYEQHLRRYANAKLGDRGIFLGTRNDVADLYRDFDVAVHPSHSENVGGAAESLPLGVPTIATEIGGFPDLVIEGETGWLAPSKSPVALAAKIAEALSDPIEAARRADNGRRLATHLFDVRRTGAEVLAEYHRMLAT